MRGMMRTVWRRVALSVVGFALVAALLGPVGLLAQGEVPVPGDITLDLKHRSIVLDAGDEQADLALMVANNSDSTREFRIVLKGEPDEWKVDLWAPSFDYKVAAVVLKESETQDLWIRVQPPSGQLEETVHTLTVQATTSIGTVLDEVDFSVQVVTSQSGTAPYVTVTSTYPVQGGSLANAPFVFDVYVRNRAGRSTSFDLTSLAPPNWEIEFVPMFGEERLISSVSMVDNGNERVNIRVRPPPTALGGNYPIIVAASNLELELEDSLTLEVTLTGKGVIQLTTGTGLLNMDAAIGRETTFVMRMGNSGTGDLQGVEITVERPPNWQVGASVTTIDLLPPQAIIDIQVTVTPPEGTLPGDYLLTFRASNPQDARALDLRVTVGQSTIWGWVGIGIVVLVVSGLGVLFVKLGRR